MKGKKTCQTFYIKTANLLEQTGNITTGRKKKEKKERKIGGKILTYLVLNFSLWKGCKKKNQTTQSARIRFLIIDNIYVAIMVYGES